MKKIELDEASAITKLALEQPVTQESDIKGVLKEINDDTDDINTQLPSIDLKTRLHPFELSSIIVHDAIISLNCLPRECMITTRIKKRLAVSENGKGREEIVRIIQGERDKQSGGLSKLKSWFTPASKE